MFDFTGEQLLERISSGISWKINEQSRVNVQLVSLASALNGDKENIIRTESSNIIEVSYMTIANTLTMHYPIEESKLKQPGKDDTSRRSGRMYHDAVKIWDAVFLNENIITVKKTMNLFWMMMIIKR
jgi:hypothetical protein